MADYCKQCAIEWFGADFRDLAGLLSKEDHEAGLVYPVTCEGCGYTWVNHEGECVNQFCPEHGSKEPPA